MAKSKKMTELEQQVGELTQDLQRTRADFENYRKRVDSEKAQAIQTGKQQAIVKLLSIVDTIERAVTHIPKELEGNAWADGVASLTKNLDKMLAELDVERIIIEPGKTEFDPDLHDAVSVDDSDGELEIVAEELQAGYMMSGHPIRHSMVKVTKQ